MRTTMRTYRSAIAALVIGVLGLPLAPIENAFAGYTSITVFGDSLSDGGNDFKLTGGAFPPLPPYAERFTNGLTAVEVLAAGLGLPLAPSLNGGSNYAYGGAETGTGNYLAVKPDVPPAINALFSPPNAGGSTGILSQVQSFIPPTGVGGSESLVVLWGGPNDLFTALTLGQDLGFTIANAMSNIADSVESLYIDGVRRILMPNMPDIGATPFGLTSGSSGDLTSFSLSFDFVLNQTIDQLEAALVGLDIIEFDTFDLLSRVVANPGAFGFTNWTDACFDGVATVCATPDSYLFWDAVHPTAAGNLIIGAEFFAAVPAPATLTLVVLGIAGMRLGRRRSAAPAATD